MSRFSLFLCVALALLAGASAHNHEHAENLISCQTPTCNGVQPTDTTFPPQCSVLNITASLGQCVQPDGAGKGFGQVFCDNAAQVAHIAYFGNDATCDPNNLQSVVSQKSGVCSGSRIVQCGHANVPLPKVLSDRPQIVKQFCGASSCSGDACTSVSYVADKCVSDYESQGSKYGKCIPDDNSHSLQQQVWLLATTPQALTCAPANAANVTLTRAVNRCAAESVVPSRYGQFVKYGCGNTVTGAAAMSAPAISMIAALIAMLAVIARMQ